MIPISLPPINNVLLMPASRSLQSELTFYGQSLLRLNVLPEEELGRERFERLWGVGVK